MGDEHERILATDREGGLCEKHLEILLRIFIWRPGGTRQRSTETDKGNPFNDDASPVQIDPLVSQVGINLGIIAIAGNSKDSMIIFANCPDHAFGVGLPAEIREISNEHNNIRSREISRNRMKAVQIIVNVSQRHNDHDTASSCHVTSARTRNHI